MAKSVKPKDKESQLLKFEEELKKERKLLDSDIKEFDKLIDKRYGNLKRNEEKFLFETRVKNKEFDKKVSAFEAEKKVIIQELKATDKLKIEYQKSIDKNKEIQESLTKERQHVREKSIELKNLETLLISKEKSLLGKENVLCDKENILKIKENELNKKEIENINDAKKLKEIEQEVNNKKYTITSLKSKYTSKLSEIEFEYRRIALLRDEIDSKKSKLSIIEKALSSKESKLRDYSDSLKNKEGNLAKISDEIEKKHKDALSTSKKIKIEKLELEEKAKSLSKDDISLDKKKKDILAMEDRIKADKENISKKSKELSLLGKDLKELQKYLGLEERDLDKKRRIIQKLRNEDNKKEGN